MVKNMTAFSTNQKTGLVKNLKMRYIIEYTGREREERKRRENEERKKRERERGRERE